MKVKYLVYRKRYEKIKMKKKMRRIEVPRSDVSSVVKGKSCDCGRGSVQLSTGAPNVDLVRDTSDATRGRKFM